MGQNPVEPRLEELGVAQGADLAPGGQQGRLDGVVSKVEVAQDPERDRHASVAGQASQRIEGLSIASLRLLHQLCVHPSLRARARAVAPSLDAIGLESVRGDLSGPILRFAATHPVPGRVGRPLGRGFELDRVDDALGLGQVGCCCLGSLLMEMTIWPEDGSTMVTGAVPSSLAWWCIPSVTDLID